MKFARPENIMDWDKVLLIIISRSIQFHMHLSDIHNTRVQGALALLRQPSLDLKTPERAR